MVTVTVEKSEPSGDFPSQLQEHETMKHQCVLQCEVTRCVSPWLIVGGEHSKITATNKVLIIHRQQRTGGGQELRVEDDLRGGQNVSKALVTTGTCH